MPKHDFTHLRATTAQSRQRQTELNAEAIGSWDAPMRKARAEARPAASKPGSSASATSSWDRAMRRVRST
jgi:hypothetical protein